MSLLYYISKSLLGEYHLTLDKSVPINLGCCQAMSFILRRCACPIPRKGISGTVAMKEWLDANADRIYAPEQGCIIISVTEGDRHGHIGTVARHNFVYLNDFGIMSNDSRTGLWDVNWSLTAWREYYETKMGLSTFYYRLDI